MGSENCGVHQCFLLKLFFGSKFHSSPDINITLIVIRILKSFIGIGVETNDFFFPSFCNGLTMLERRAHSEQEFLRFIVSTQPRELLFLPDKDMCVCNFRAVEDYASYG